MRYNTFSNIVRKTALCTGLFCAFAPAVMAQDTCFVAVRIENKVEPFVIKPDANGKIAGVISQGLNGDIYLYTNRPFVKVINESSQNFRNKNTGEYRVIMFDGGQSTTYDFVKNRETGAISFQPKNVKNFQNQIYFGGDLNQSRMYFQLENNDSYRRYLQIRKIAGEFGGIDRIDVTIASEGQNDTVVSYSDNLRADSLILAPGQSVKRVAVTRLANGVLNGISINDTKLEGKYTFRNSSVVSDMDRLAARSATLTTTDSTLALNEGLLRIDYSFIEGDCNAQAESKEIVLCVKANPNEEASSSWLWILLALIAAGGAGFYFYRRHQLKKSGVIPETDAEKVVRLTGEVATHKNTIENLKKVESSLLGDKELLQNKVKNLNEQLQTSKNETMLKAAESNGYHDQLQKLQLHCDNVQSTLDEANRRIAVYESGEEAKEIQRLNQHIDDLKVKHEQQLVAAENKKKKEMEALIEANEQKMSDVRYECQTQLVAVNSDKENAVAAIEADRDQRVSTLMAEKEEIISTLTAQMEEAVTDALNDRDEKVAAAVADRDQRVAAAIAERDQKVAAANRERDEKVAALMKERDEKLAALKAERDETVNRLMIEKSDAIALALSEKEQAIGQAIADKEEAVGAAVADRDEKVAAANRERDQRIAALEAERDEKVALLEADRDEKVSAAISEKEQAVAKALREKEEAIETALREKEEAIAEALAEKNIAVTTANEERDRAVKAAEVEKENALALMKAKQAQEMTEERQKTADAEDRIRQASALFIEQLERSVDAIVGNITTMQMEVTDSHQENNYTNVISHMCQKVLDFERWFKREIVEAQQDNIWTIDDVRNILQAKLTPELSNNYTWVSEMVRFTSYCAISRQFKDQFRKSGVPTDYLRNAYAETVTFFGRMGITLLVPALFADDFNPECHKLNNAPLINSFFPHTFMEYKPESKGMIYDVLRPGYSCEGEVRQLPEVCVY
ncbi:MAG: hypothetical protein Q4B58_03305 [Bacteroidales bacterium]|nr:hypothetical protein [Bacteroidales bacterium]